LVTRAQGGDAEAMNDLLRSVQPRVLAVCRGVLPFADDAEDASQEALLNVARKLDGFNGRSKFTTWLHVVALNSARSTYRRLKNQAVSMDDIALERPDPRTTSVIAGTRLDLLDALDIVESTHPQVIEPLVLRDVYGLSYEEIARLTASPVGTVKSRVHDARQLVRPLLRPRE
jgi:RNA polymerase sigma-70 factor (ECF subfamily)